MSIILQLRSVATSIGGTLFRTKLIADMGSIENALNLHQTVLDSSNQMSLDALSATSSSSVAIGTGSKSFTIQTGKSFIGGQYVQIADAAAPSTNSMGAQVTSYNPATGALVVESLYVRGSGTIASWLISLGSVLDYSGSASQAFSTAALTTTGLVDISGASAGQIKFPASGNLSGEVNTLDYYEELTTTFTLVGCTTSPGVDFKITRVGDTVTLSPTTNSGVISGTSNSTGKYLTGLPTWAYPGSLRNVLCITSDNGGASVVAMAIVSTGGNFILFSSPAGNSFTASGVFAATLLTCSYQV